MKRDKSKMNTMECIFVFGVDKICADHFDNIINLILIFFRIKFYVSDIHYSSCEHDRERALLGEREQEGERKMIQSSCAKRGQREEIVATHQSNVCERTSCHADDDTVFHSRILHLVGT